MILRWIIGFLMLSFYPHILQAEVYGVIDMIETSLVNITVLLIGGFWVDILLICHEQAETRKGLL